MHLLPRLACSFALGFALFSIGASSALAEGAIPPGNAGADQYAEGVPGADGNNSPAGGGSDDGSSGGGGLPQSVVEELQQQGPAGAEAAAILDETAPPGQGGQRQADGGAGGSSPGQASDDERSDDAPGNIIDTVLTGSGAGGMGVALPILLAIVLIGALLMSARRRLGGDGHPSSSA